MKVKAKYFLMFLTTLLLVSCNDWMDLKPPGGLIREDFWKQKEDVEAVLMSAYEGFASMDRTLFVLGEVRADMLQGGTNQPLAEQLLMENNIYPDNSLSDWRGFYTIINYCNEVIKNAPIVREIDNTFSDFSMYSLMSEAYFLRSLSYFYLVRIYRDVPLILNPSETDDTDFYVAKSSENEILTQIISDLETNRIYAPSGSFPTLAENKGRASKAAFDALLADIALWRFDYDGVLNHIQKIEENTEFVLLPNSKWFELYYPGNSLESIFEFQFDGSLNQNNSTYSLTQRYSYQYEPSQKAVEMFGDEFSSELIRGEDSSIKKIGDDDYIIWKYVGQAPDGRTSRVAAEAYSANWIVYRLADVLLMKAEALSQLQQFDEALLYLNKIRFRANISSASIAYTSSAFEDAILNERALELAFEGKRWFDLVRMGRRNNFARKDKLIEIIISNVPSTQKRILAAKLTNSLGWFLPIYETEIERNKNLIQNPYYDN